MNTVPKNTRASRCVRLLRRGGTASIFKLRREDAGSLALLHIFQKSPGVSTPKDRPPVCGYGENRWATHRQGSTRVESETLQRPVVSIGRDSNKMLTGRGSARAGREFLGLGLGSFRLFTTRAVYGIRIYRCACGHVSHLDFDSAPVPLLWRGSKGES